MIMQGRKDALDNFDMLSGFSLSFEWRKDDIEKVLEMVKDGKELAVIAKKVKRQGIEVLILIDDLKKKSRLKGIEFNYVSTV